MNGGPLPAGPFNQSGKDPGRIAWSNIRLQRMLQVAYDLPADHISVPASFDTLGYDLQATLPAGTNVADFRRMLQSLLIDRFRLASHREDKQVSGYTLEIGKGGIKIKPSPLPQKAAPAAANDDDGQKSSPEREAALAYMASRTPDFRAMIGIDQRGFAIPRPGNRYYPPGAAFGVTIVVNGRFRATKLNATMPEIATFLAGLAGGPGEDRTSLAGKYDVYLEYVPRQSAAGAAAAATDEPGPDVLDAVQQQLGLKLTSAKVPVETLVIDRAEKTPLMN